MQRTECDDINREYLLKVTQNQPQEETHQGAGAQFIQTVFYGAASFLRLADVKEGAAVQMELCSGGSLVVY